MTFSKSTAYAVSAGILLGWFTMGGIWLIKDRNGADDPDSTPAMGITMTDTGAESGAGFPTLPPGTSIDDPRISFRQLDRLAENAALADPVAAARNAETIPGYDNRQKYFGTVLQTWGETDGKSAAEWVAQEYQGEKLTDALYYVADGWAESDPEAAGDWFLENTDGVILEDAAWEVLEAWGRKDPEAAFAWSEKIDDYTKEGILFGLAEGWGAVDPVAAAQAGMDMEGELQYEFLTSVTTQWAGSDPEALGAWAQTLLSERLRAGVLAEMGEVWAETDPAAATKWSESLDKKADRYYLENGIVSGWSEHDPGGALEWAIENVEDQEALGEMVGDVVFNWTNADPAGTAEWLEQKSEGPEKDLILEMFSDGIVGIDPVAAVAWTKEISDAEKRDQKLRIMAAQWFAMEGPGSLESMRRMGIPEHLIQEIGNK